MSFMIRLFRNTKNNNDNSDNHNNNVDDDDHEDDDDEEENEEDEEEDGDNNVTFQHSWLLSLVMIRAIFLYSNLAAVPSNILRSTSKDVQWASIAAFASLNIVCSIQSAYCKDHSSVDTWRHSCIRRSVYETDTMRHSQHISISWSIDRYN